MLLHKYLNREEADDKESKSTHSPKPMSTNFSGKGFSMCVYSKTKGLFCASHKVHRWHHSSLLAGESCMFAGELKVERGIVKVLTNKSGHYKPGEEATLKMLEELAARGMDLSDVIFHFVDKRGESQRHNTLDLLKTLQEKHHQTK